MCFLRGTSKYHETEVPYTMLHYVYVLLRAIPFDNWAGVVSVFHFTSDTCWRLVMSFALIVGGCAILLNIYEVNQKI